MYTMMQVHQNNRYQAHKSQINQSKEISLCSLQQYIPLLGKGKMNKLSKSQLFLNIHLWGLCHQQTASKFKMIYKNVMNCNSARIRQGLFCDLARDVTGEMVPLRSIFSIAAAVSGVDQSSRHRGRVHLAPASDLRPLNE